MKKDKRDYKMDIFTENKQLIEERKNRYIQEALSQYGNVKTLTYEKYKSLKKEFENGNKNAIRQLFEESTMDIISATASLYAKYDVEKYVSFEEVLSFVFEHLFNYHINYEFLPANRIAYLSNMVQFNCYCLINRAYQLNKAKSRECLMTNQDIAWIVDKQDADFISMENLNLEDLNFKLIHVMDCLSQKEQRIVKLILGFETGEKITFEECSKILKLSKARTCDIFHKAIKKLQNAKATKKIVDYANTDLTI